MKNEIAKIIRKTYGLSPEVKVKDIKVDFTLEGSLNFNGIPKKSVVRNGKNELRYMRNQIWKWRVLKKLQPKADQWLKETIGKRPNKSLTSAEKATIRKIYETHLQFIRDGRKGK